MRVFPDTNVLASAFGTRGLCSHVFTLVITEHELITCAAVIAELHSVLRRKFRVPAATVEEVVGFLRGYENVRQRSTLPDLPLDRDDLAIVGSAIAGRAEVFITGDRRILELPKRAVGVRIASPREFWESERVKQRR